MNEPLIAPHPFGHEITLAALNEQLQTQSTWEDKYRLLIQLARKLPPLSDSEKQQAEEVRGCENRVWIGYQRNSDGSLHFFGDSEGRIVKGLLAILLTNIEGKLANEILAIDLLDFFNKTGLAGQLSVSRQNGIQSLINEIRRVAQVNQ